MLDDLGYKDKLKAIKLIVFDIDGVLTDGRIYIDHTGNEVKSVSLREIDAVFSLQRNGYMIGAITGEDTPMTDYFKGRFVWDYFYTGCKNKLDKLKEIEQNENISSEQILYIGDGKYDAEVLSYAGIGVCPSDGSEEAKRNADIILEGRGGYDCVQELEGMLIIR